MGSGVNSRLTSASNSAGGLGGGVNNGQPVMSTTHEHLSMQLGGVCTPEEILAENPGFGLLEIDVAALLARGLRATYSPSLGKGHVSVWGLKAASKAILRELQEQILRAWEPVTEQLVRKLPGA